MGLEHGRPTWRLDQPRTAMRWRYEGIGWPRSLDEVRIWIPGTVVLVAATIWGHLAIVPAGRIIPGHVDQHRTDFTVFTEAGAAFFDGRNPYRVANPRGWHYLYPPLFALLVSPLSAFDTASQVGIWYSLNVAFALLCFCEVRRLWCRVLGEQSRQCRWVAACALLAVFLPFLDCMQAGQLGIAILYLLLLGFRLVLEQRRGWHPFAAGLILALPAVVKLVPALPVMCLLMQQWAGVLKPGSRPRRWARAQALTAGVAMGVVLFLFAIPAAFLGWRANLAYLDQWYGRVVANERVGHQSNFNIHSYRNQSLANAVHLVGRAALTGSLELRDARPADDHAERLFRPAIRGMVVFVLFVLLIVGASVGRREDPLDQVTAYALACCASLVVSPLSWGHYYMAMAPAALFAPVWLLRSGRLSQARRVVVILPIAVWSHYLALPYAGGLGLLGLGTTFWFLWVCGSILRVELARTSAIPPPHLMRRNLREVASHAGPNGEVLTNSVSGRLRRRSSGHRDFPPEDPRGESNADGATDR
jgi:hypothetical protein